MIFSTYRFILTLVTVSGMVGVIPVVAIDWASFDFSAKYDEPPIAVITVQPEFPEDAFVNGKAELLLAVLVDVEGKVGDVVMLEEGVAPEVADAVIEAVLQNRYEPAKYHGNPVEVWYMILVPITSARKKPEPGADSGSIVPKGLERK